MNNMRSLKHVISVTILGLVILVASGCKTTTPQTKFTTPDSAATAVQQAFKKQDMDQIHAIFGQEWIEAVASGDQVADRHDREVIALAMDQSWRWVPHGAAGKELIIGDENWPFPVPLVKSGQGWRFDSAAGKQEVSARRIGGNELGVISICRDYVRAQKEYASQPHDGKPAGLFAQRFRSSPGHHDGLFWGRQRWEESSPLDQLVTAAVAEGYDPNKPDASPFRGYRFRILTAQGPAAPGGPKSYVVDGAMTGGFGLVAWPAKYAFSGVMTFVVGQDGLVYQKDLGPDTDTQAARLAEYNPDKSWTAIQSP
jgi:hypothetical protein